MTRLRILIAAILFLAVAGAAASRAKKPKAGGASAGQFDYYLLTLSWAPDFCAAPGGNKDPRECGAGKHIGFVVHGLWPQGESGRGPENCGSVSPVSQAIIAATLNYIPSNSLIQHEWTAHGSCSGLSADDYFATVRKARDSVTIPPDLASLTQQTSESAAQVEAQFAAANPSFPKAAFRATCTGGALQEARICLAKDLTARECTASAGECTAPSMKILPPR